MPSIPHPFTLGTILPPEPEIGDLIAFQLNGLIVVGSALVLIWGLMELLGAFFRRAEAAALAAAAGTAGAPGGAQTVATPIVGTVAPPEIPATDLVLIAAAVHATLGPRARIISLSPRPEARDWAAEGRRAIFATHKVR
jgi:hypothetical protein